jgi:hypothetical protein
MQLAMLAPDRAPISGNEARAIDRRIEHLMRVKALCGALKPGCEGRFDAIMTTVRHDIAGTDPAVRNALLSALDVVSLELCDE